MLLQKKIDFFFLDWLKKLVSMAHQIVYEFQGGGVRWRGAHFLLSFSMASAADIFLPPPSFAALSPFYNCMWFLLFLRGQCLRRGSIISILPTTWCMNLLFTVNFAFSKCPKLFFFFTSLCRKLCTVQCLVLGGGVDRHCLDDEEMMEEFF